MSSFLQSPVIISSKSHTLKNMGMEKLTHENIHQLLYEHDLLGTDFNSHLRYEASSSWIIQHNLCHEGDPAIVDFSLNIHEVLIYDPTSDTIKLHVFELKKVNRIVDDDPIIGLINLGNPIDLKSLISSELFDFLQILTKKIIGYKVKAPSSDGFWSLHLNLQADLLKKFDVSAFSKSLIEYLVMPTTDGQQLYLVINELFSNAVEHGVLKLGSSLKIDDEGFQEYYQKRETLLKSLSNGHIIISISHEKLENVHYLKFNITDSGKGFDHKHFQPDVVKGSHAYGRGLSLVKANCKKLNFIGEGNQVEVLYQW